MQSINSGMQYAENSNQPALSDENLAHLNAESLQDSLAQTKIDTTSQLFVLPAFLDMALHTNAKRIDFKDLKLENVTGEQARYTIQYGKRKPDNGLPCQERTGGNRRFRPRHGRREGREIDRPLPFDRHISSDASFVRRSLGLPDHGYLQDGFDHVSHYAVHQFFLLSAREQYGTAGRRDIYRNIQNADVQKQETEYDRQYFRGSRHSGQ